MLKHMLAPGPGERGATPGTGPPGTGPPGTGNVMGYGGATSRLHPHPHPTYAHHHAVPSPQFSLNHSDPLAALSLHASTISTSKHSLGNSSSVSKVANGGLHISRTHNGAPPVRNGVPPGPSAPVPATPRADTGPSGTPPPDTSPFSETTSVVSSLGSLGLLSVASLILALLGVLSVLRLARPSADLPDTLMQGSAMAMCALAMVLDLCCLVVCIAQILFAVKMIKSPRAAYRTEKYLRKSAYTRVCAVSGFFVSIPVYMTGMILFSLIHFQPTPAIVAGVFIAFGILFSGLAMVHNVFIWQKEKTNAVRARAKLQQQQQGDQQQSQGQQLQTPQHQHHRPTQLWTSSNGGFGFGTSSPAVASVGGGGSGGGSGSGGAGITVLSGMSGSGSGVPIATLDLSSVTTTPHELSTLV